MIAQSFEITGHISKSISYQIESFLRWFCSLVVLSLASDRTFGGSIPCQASATLLILSKIVLFPPFRLQLWKNSKYEVEFIMSNKLCRYVQINSVAKPSLK